MCPNCKKEWFSMLDRNYLKLFNRCWDCDKKDWQEDKLDIEEFERREKDAIDYKA